jgi:hypothetical protein
MGTKAEELAKMHRGEGCLGKADDDEPIFILRAGDRFSATVVEIWADIVATQRGDKHPKVVGARQIARAMTAWPTQKVPD